MWAMSHPLAGIRQVEADVDEIGVDVGYKGLESGLQDALSPIFRLAVIVSAIAFSRPGSTVGAP